MLFNAFLQRFRPAPNRRGTTYIHWLLIVFGSAASLSYGSASEHNSGSLIEAPATPLRVTTQALEFSAQAHEIYFYKLLELALQKTEPSHGAYELGQYPRRLSNQRYIAEVSRPNGLIDITWTMSSAERERDMLAIKFSLLRGMNSHRVLLIRAQDSAEFGAITELNQLRKLSAGSGSVWPDTNILRNNHLPVVTSAHYELLFSMLQRKRFDYFPRGVYEAWNEQATHKDKGLIIEPRLMLYYPAPIYYFVHKGNRQLAERIQAGLSLAVADGSFDRLFFSIPGFSQGYQEMNNKNRLVFQLESPHQSPQENP